MYITFVQKSSDIHNLHMKLNSLDGQSILPKKKRYGDHRNARLWTMLHGLVFGMARQDVMFYKNHNSVGTTKVCRKRQNLS